MERKTQLRCPAQQHLNWKVFSGALGLALACVLINPDVMAGEVSTGKTGGTLNFNSCSKPVWPAEALAQRRTGTVTLAFLIDSDGKVKQSKVHKSSGHAELDEAARAAIAQCTFTPGMSEGRPAEAWLQVQYVWTSD